MSHCQLLLIEIRDLIEKEITDLIFADYVELLHLWL